MQVNGCPEQTLEKATCAFEEVVERVRAVKSRGAHQIRRTSDPPEKSVQSWMHTTAAEADSRSSGHLVDMKLQRKMRDVHLLVRMSSVALAVLPVEVVEQAALAAAMGYNNSRIRRKDRSLPIHHHRNCSLVLVSTSSSCCDSHSS